MPSTTTSPLAIDGGTPVRTTPWPKRHLFGEEEKQAALALFDQAIESGDVIGYNGPEEQAYCEEFACWMGGGYADAVNSGTAAVYVALRSLDLPPYSEVIVPPITDPGGCMPVPLLGCVPVPADAAPGSYNAGPEQIAARITPRTSAILVAHIAGLPADMDPILALARQHGLPVVEDCAQAHGATYKGRLVGSMGDVAAFSTMSGKHHATAAQGGVVFTKDEQRYWKARRASDRGKPFGLENAGGNVVASLNLNSNDLASAVGRVQLRKLPGIIKNRQRTANLIAQRCREELQAVRLNTGLPQTGGAYWFLLLRLDLPRLSVDKTQFVRALSAEGMPVSPSYWHAPTQQPWAKNRLVLGTPGWPWTAPEYKGDPNAVYELPNARAADDVHFMMGFHERVGEAEVDDLLAALRKLESVYLK